MRDYAVSASFVAQPNVILSPVNVYLRLRGLMDEPNTITRHQYSSYDKAKRKLIS